MVSENKLNILYCENEEQFDRIYERYKNKKDILTIYQEKYFYIFQKENLIEELSCKDNLLFLCDLYHAPYDEQKINDISKEYKINEKFFPNKASYFGFCKNSYSSNLKAQKIPHRSQSPIYSYF